MQRQSLIQIFLGIFALFIMLSPTFASSSNDVTIRVTGDYPAIGNMEVRLFRSLEDYFQSRPFQQIVAPALSRGMEITMEEIPPGDYIISILHDVNGDGKMNANAFGVPIESSGFYKPGAAAGTPVNLREAVFNLSGDNRLWEFNLPPPGAESRAWGAGVMAILSSNPYRGGDTVIRVLPLLTFVGEHLYVIGPRVGFNVHKSRFISANLTAEFKFAGDAFEDEKFLDGMENRRDTVMAGFDFTLRGFGRWRLELSALSDVLNRHDGQEVNLSVGRNIRGHGWSITPGIGAVWRSSNYNNYYYGVHGNEATETHPEYMPGAGVDWFGKIIGRYEITDAWSLIGSVKLEYLNDDIQDSPIVDKQQLVSSFLGINYAF